MPRSSPARAPDSIMVRTRSRSRSGLSIFRVRGDEQVELVLLPQVVDRLGSGAELRQPVDRVVGAVALPDRPLEEVAPGGAHALPRLLRDHLEHEHQVAVGDALDARWRSPSRRGEGRARTGRGCARRPVRAASRRGTRRRPGRASSAGRTCPASCGTASRHSRKVRRGAGDRVSGASELIPPLPGPGRFGGAGPFVCVLERTRFSGRNAVTSPTLFATHAET